MIAKFVLFYKKALLKFTESSEKVLPWVVVFCQLIVELSCFTAVSALGLHWLINKSYNMCLKYVGYKLIELFLSVFVLYRLWVILRDLWRLCRLILRKIKNRVFVINNNGGDKIEDQNGTQPPSKKKLHKIKKRQV